MSVDLLPGVQCCINYCQQCRVVLLLGRPLLLLGLLGGLAVLVIILGCCPVFRPSCVRDVVVGVGLALAVHPPVGCLAIFDSS